MRAECASGRLTLICRSEDANTPPSFANKSNPTFSIATDKLIFVQSVVVDGKDRVWALDTGRPRINGSMLLAATPGGPKLVGYDLNGTTFATITFPDSVVAADSSLNDVRFDLRGDGFAYISDSSMQRPGIVVVNLKTGESWRHLDGHPSVSPQAGFIPFHNGSGWSFVDMMLKRCSDRLMTSTNVSPPAHAPERDHILQPCTSRYRTRCPHMLI